MSVFAEKQPLLAVIFEGDIAGKALQKLCEKKGEQKCLTVGIRLAHFLFIQNIWWEHASGARERKAIWVMDGQAIAANFKGMVKTSLFSLQLLYSPTM